MFGVFSGKMSQAFVECREDQIVCNRHAEQVRIRGNIVMLMTLKEAGDQQIDIDQIKGFSQDRPQTLPSPF